MKLEAIPDFPMIVPGDDLAAIIIEFAEEHAVPVSNGDIFVLAQKIVSKSENRYVILEEVTPSHKAYDLARTAQKDPRLVELILADSREVLRAKPGVLIVQHRLGYVMANAGIDTSNLSTEPNGKERVLLLPKDPDNTCKRLQKRFEEHFQKQIGVIINDSVGRAWRNGSVGMALGVAGVPALWDRVGDHDLFNRRLDVTQIALGDQIASAAALVMGEANEGQPVVLVSGLDWEPVPTDGKSLMRPKEQDLFR